MLYLLKILLSLAALVAIPIVLILLLATLDNSQHQGFAISASMIAWGIAYKMLGSLDLIPDWLPLIGKLDDLFVVLIIFIGIGVGAFAYFVL